MCNILVLQIYTQNNITWVVVTNLLPYHEYKVTVSGIPIVGHMNRGFWSEGANYTFRTLQDGKYQQTQL